MESPAASAFPCRYDWTPPCSLMIANDAFFCLPVSPQHALRGASAAVFCTAARLRHLLSWSRSRGLSSPIPWVTYCSTSQSVESQDQHFSSLSSSHNPDMIPQHQPQIYFTTIKALADLLSRLVNTFLILSRICPPAILMPNIFFAYVSYGIPTNWRKLSTNQWSNGNSVEMLIYNTQTCAVHNLRLQFIFFLAKVFFKNEISQKTHGSTVFRPLSSDPLRYHPPVSPSVPAPVPTAGPPYYPGQTVYPPSPPIIVPTPQQPPPAKREKKTVSTLVVSI